MMPARRPNILLIQSDQHRFDCVGANGQAALRTPAMDRLAREGVNFMQAYTPIPLCTPARASLLCGCWPITHGCIANPESEAWQPMAGGLPLFPELLRAAGYRTAYVGKWHVDNRRSPLEHGFERYVPEEDYTRWRAGQGLPAVHRTEWDWAGLFGETDTHATPEQSRLAWGAGEVLRMLDDYAAGGSGGGPWFVRWDPSEPHLPNLVPEPYASRHEPKGIPPWPGFADPLAHKPYIQKQVRRTWGVEGWPWEKWQPVVGRYLGEVELLDAQIGRLLAWLDERGLTEDTLVVYTSDHGDMCGSHGMMDKHYVMYDDVVRVPLLIRWPAGGVSGGRGCAAPVIHALDLPPALLEAAGVAVPEAFQGKSLLPWARGGTEGWRETVFAMYHGNFFGLYTQRMVAADGWKYVWNATAEDELYCVAEDPGEIRNRFGDPAAAERQRDLRRRMVAWMESIRDPMLHLWSRGQLLGGTKQ